MSLSFSEIEKEHIKSLAFIESLKSAKSLPEIASETESANWRH